MNPVQRLPMTPQRRGRVALEDADDPFALIGAAARGRERRVDEDRFLRAVEPGRERRRQGAEPEFAGVEIGSE